MWSLLWIHFFFCYVPKYLGIPVVTKYFKTFVCLCPEVGLDFCYFTLTFSHFYTQNTWQFSFPHSCRYGKYLSFANLRCPCNGFGGWEICIRRTSAEEVLSMSRNQNWSLLRQNKSTCLNSIPSFLLATCIMGLNMNIPAIFNLWDPILSELSHSQSPQHFRTYLKYLETNTETFFYSMAKLRKLISFQSKWPKFCHFQGLKAVRRKNYHCKPHFF